jgi:hypothetical protein
MARKPLGGKGPVRRIVRTIRHDSSPMVRDLLDCGHALTRLDDKWNHTIRPCWKCERGDAPEELPRAR